MNVKGYTLIELLTVITFLTPVETGLLEGKRSGVIGGLIGLWVGLVIAVLWALVWFYWQRRNWEKILNGRWYSVAYILGIFMAMVALPVVSAIITNQLTVLYHH